MKKLFLYVFLGLLWCNFSLASDELIIEYNKKLLNKKLSIKEIVKICKEYESKNIDASQYAQVALNIDIGIHNYCTTTKIFVITKKIAIKIMKSTISFFI